MVGCEFQSLPGQPRQQLEREVGRPRCVLVVEQPVELRHAVPPARHEHHAVMRHESREAVEVNVPVANVVVARIVQPCVLHLPDRFHDVTRLKARIERRVHQVHVPFVEERLGFEQRMSRQQTLRVINRVAHRARTAAVDVPRDGVQRRLVCVAEIQQRRKNRRLHAGQRRSADARLQIRPQNRRRSVLVIAHVTLRLEPIRTTAALADVRFVGDLPVTNSRSALPVMPHQIENQLLPLGVIVRLDYVVIDLGKERARLEANTHERLRPRREDRRHGAIQCVEVITAAFGQQIEILLDEQANDAGLERANFGDAIVPHRFLGQPALAERHLVDFQRPEAIGERDADLRGLRLRGRAQRAGACETEQQPEFGEPHGRR